MYNRSSPRPRQQLTNATTGRLRASPSIAPYRGDSRTRQTWYNCTGVQIRRAYATAFGGALNFVRQGRATKATVASICPRRVARLPAGERHPRSRAPTGVPLYQGIAPVKAGD
jgi:hypothetical protein